ncbi:MAG: hypothetical protein K0S74_1574 [Chlamydiales bacterium]|jgi:uncharacterized protein (TIGR00251 family)|nr:hypothetical protein [Chlamydiales bacterium]
MKKIQNLDCINEKVYLSVKVIPQAHRNELIGWEQECLKVRIAAPPEKGKANDSLLRFLAAKLDVRLSQISIESGDTNKRKRLSIVGLSWEDIKAKLV